MSRMPLSVRAAVAGDVAVLREVWADVLRRGSVAEQEADVLGVIADCADRNDRYIAVAEIDGEVAGAVLLQATTLTPLNLEPALLAVSPHVLPGFRRRGVGTALMDAATRYAEAEGIGTVATAAMANSRDANRFMARLSLTPQAMLRAANTSAVRSKLSARRSVFRYRGSRQVDKVLAARRLGRENVAN